jgi:hypothetical protein
LGVEPETRYQNKTKDQFLPVSITTHHEKGGKLPTLSTTLLGLSTLLNSLISHSPGLAILGLHTREIVRNQKRGTKVTREPKHELKKPRKT